MQLQNWWYTTLLGTEEAMLPFLEGDHQTDVLVVGAGAAGLAAALTLSEAGRKVAILERNVCGGSSTGKSAGFLTPDSELELSQLVRRFGPQGAKDLWECATHGIDLMVGAIRAFEIHCDLQVQDSLFLGNDKGGWEDAQEEVKARAELGYPQTIYDESQLKGVLGAEGYTGAVRYPGTYGVDALRYAQGIKQVLLERGVRIFEGSEAKRIEGHRVITHAGSISADQIIFCIDKPQAPLVPMADEVYHAQTFLSISEPLSDAEVAKLFPDKPMQCWDSDLVYSYYRLTGDQRLLLGGGSALTTFSGNDVNSDRVIRRVVKGFKNHYPYLRELEFVQFWPGRIDCTRDLMPTVVCHPDNPHVHFVLGCVGLPWATFCGDFAARNVLGTAEADDQKYYRYFAGNRDFLLPTWLERIVGKQMVFSLNNAWSKYKQVDTDRHLVYQKGQF
jgi:gamma-glutamylputrescine oxidase